MIDPTEDEIDRACAAGNYGTGREIMRIMLRSAFNPPEVNVTTKQMEEGCRAWLHNQPPSPGSYPSKTVMAIYRAMRALEPDKRSPEGSPIGYWRGEPIYSSKGHTHSRSGDFKMGDRVRYFQVHHHRRDGDS